MADLETQIDQLGESALATIDRLQEQVRRQRAEIEARDAAIERLKATLSEKDHEIARLKVPVVITVRQRSNDWHAQLSSDAGVWGAGKSPYEAIGSCVNAHPEEFRLEMRAATDDARGKSDA